MKNWKNIKKPQVSVCCITYNHEPYIRDAIEGFLMQETDFPFEIIIHDDASTDKTAEIVREYESKFPKLIKAIYQTENQYSKGIMISPNFVWPKAKGEYIALCEGDDYWTDPEKLQIQVDILENNSEFVFCFHNAKIIYDKSLKSSRKFNNLDKNIFSIIDVIEKPWFVPTQSIVCRKYLLEEPSWNKYVFNGDLSIQLNLATKGNFFYINKVMSIYRKSPSGISNNRPPGFHAFKLTETLCLFNLYTNFKYNHYIQKRIESIRDTSYISFITSRPLFIKLISIEYYIFRFKWLMKKLEKLNINTFDIH